MKLLKQSTEITKRIGPFVDNTDGVTEEVGLVGGGTEISKNGGAYAAGPTLGTHDAEGYYPVTLTTTHTDTLGLLEIKSHNAATHLPVWDTYMVVPAVVYDTLVGGTDDLNCQVVGMDNDVVTAAAIANNAIGSTEIADGAITAAKIDADAITEAKIADNAIAAEHIATDAITDTKIAANAIGASELADGAIDSGAFASGAITADAIASNAITAAKIANDAITSQKIDAGAITSGAIANNALTSSAFQNNSLTAAALATDAVQEIRDAILSDSTPFAGANIGTILSQTATVCRALATGTATSGSTTTLVDTARTEADTDYWKGGWLVITSGDIAGQARKISAYDSGADTFTVERAFTQAVATNTYEVWPADFPNNLSALQIETDGMAHADLKEFLGSAPNALVAGAVDADVSAIQADVITAAALAADAVDEIKDDLLVFKKNTAVAIFPFLMKDSTTSEPKTGLTVTVQRSIDGAAFGNIGGSVTEVSDGWYYCDLFAADTNGDVFALKFSAAGAKTLNISVRTKP
jgi:hypothetical protein